MVEGVGVQIDGKKLPPSSPPLTTSKPTTIDTEKFGNTKIDLKFFSLVEFFHIPGVYEILLEKLNRKQTVQNRRSKEVKLLLEKGILPNGLCLNIILKSLLENMVV